MKRNLVKKFTAGAMAMAVAVGGVMVSSVGVMAANYTAVAGTTTAFDKYLVMDKQANVPNVSFQYAITAGTAQDYNVSTAAGVTKTVQVLAGVTPENVTMAGVGSTTANTIAFEQADTTDTTVVKSDANANVKDYDNTTEKYAVKTATLDFSKCVFPEPGIYRYVITESGTNQAVTNDADVTRTLDVYVVDNNGVLEVTSYVLHATESDLIMGDNNGTIDIAADEKKSQGFTNTYDTSDLTIRKEVSGNQASRDKYFAITVDIANAVPGTVYTVDITNAEATSGTNAATIDANANKQNVTSITVPAAAANQTTSSVSTTFYLQHGQEIKIQGIAKESTYAVTENAEDYKSTPAGVANYADSVTGTVVSTDLKTSFLNTRAGVIPTGVIMTVAPFAAVTLLGGFGAVRILMKKKKSEDEE